MLDDPILTQAGFSYDKSILLEHFKKNGNIDPISRKPINAKV